MPNVSINVDNDALISRLKGAIRAYENKYISTNIGFVDELTQRLCESYFKENCFSCYSYFSPHDDSTRRFLTVGDLELDESELVYIHAVPDKFHQPTHRDYMGALMSLKIDRKLFGDILTTNYGDAFLVFWNKSDVLAYITDSFVSCGSARLTLKEITRERYNSLEMQYEEIGLIVSSLRADCIVAAISNLSRAKACEIIKAGDFKVFSTSVYSVDFNISDGDVFSVRGFGKFRYNGVLGSTRRERMRISLLKFGNYIERNTVS